MSISVSDPFARREIGVLGTTISCIDEGEGNPIVFLHGNPTSSYLWRNVIPHSLPHGRALAPDLVGMGASGPSSTGAYRLEDHIPHIDAWLEAVGADRDVVLVGHDWGSALAFHWASRHPGAVKGIAYMEAIVQPLAWDEWPAADLFKAMRSEAGEEIILTKNVFVERILPASVIRDLGEEMEVYRRPYVEPGESRRPTLTWPREIPLDGEPADVHALVADYARFMAEAPFPKLYVNCDPGSILTGTSRKFCRTWPNQIEVTVPGVHFVQEDSPDEIGEALAGFLGSL
jgi:haloalkane dehalogenase